MCASRVYAVIPAAGISERMGRPKLTLPLGAGTVIDRVLEALAVDGVHSRVVVARRDQTDLHRCVTASAARLVVPETDPPDMRASVEAALRFIESEFAPDARDAWMLTPGDCVGVTESVVRELVSIWNTSPDASVLLPRVGGHRGHPALFRWSLISTLRALPSDVGVNALLDLPALQVIEHPVSEAGVLVDLDTPEDYRRAQQKRPRT